MNINVQKNENELTQIDKLSQAMCRSNDGNAYQRLLVGVYIPYEPISDQLDPTKTYYFDKVTNENGQKTFEYYAWRRWGYRASDLINELHEAGLQLTEVKQIDTES